MNSKLLASALGALLLGGSTLALADNWKGGHRHGHHQFHDRGWHGGHHGRSPGYHYAPRHHYYAPRHHYYAPRGHRYYAPPRYWHQNAYELDGVTFTISGTLR
jgi:hypothetical protein